MSATEESWRDLKFRAEVGGVHAIAVLVVLFFMPTSVAMAVWQGGKADDLGLPLSKYRREFLRLEVLCAELATTFTQRHRARSDRSVCQCLRPVSGGSQRLGAKL